MFAERGLPLIVLLAVANGALATWCIADLASDRASETRQHVNDRNLEQAEQRMVACIESRPFTIGTAIYVPETRKSDLTTAQVPELGKSIAVF